MCIQNAINRYKSLQLLIKEHKYRKHFRMRVLTVNSHSHTLTQGQIYTKKKKRNWRTKYVKQFNVSLTRCYYAETDEVKKKIKGKKNKIRAFGTDARTQPLKSEDKFVLRAAYFLHTPSIYAIIMKF